MRAAVALLVLGCALGCGDDIGNPNEGTGSELGDRCAEQSDCASGLCTEISRNVGLCTMSCSDPLSKDECPAGWRCRRPDDIDQLVCVCTPSGPEICDDKVDNDCDGKVDDCLTCDGRHVSRNDRLHCGACETRCVAGSRCDDGECVCAAADPDDCVAGADDPVCTADAQCDDGIDCTLDSCLGGRCLNRIEPNTCPSGESCDPRLGGCTRGADCRTGGAASNDCRDMDPCTTFEQCSSLGTCQYLLLDDDDDGVPPPQCGGSDCSDGDPRRFPGAAEVCDGIDNDCDAHADETPASDACAGGGSCKAGSCVCDDGKTLCAVESACVDLQTDDSHCGSCSVRCRAGVKCVDGACEDIDECAQDAMACPEFSTCNNVQGTYQCVCNEGFVPDATMTGCIDIDECATGTDNCPQGCSNTEGSFECTCADGYTGDGRTCTDVDECQADPDICGDHGLCTNTIGAFNCTCDFGYVREGTSANGSCVVGDACQAGLQPDHAWCDGACRDTRTDAAHCNGCGNSCGNGICQNSACACADSGLTHCGDDGCVNLLSSPAHCNGCEHPCPTGAGCVAGGCVCPGGTTECGGACVSLGTTAHCTSCTDVCPTGASCSGTCTCPGGTPTACNGACVNLTNDANNCMICGHACPTGANCVSSACACPAQTPDTCQNTCVNRQSDEAHCGVCGTACGVICNVGSCTTATQIVAGDGFSCALFADKRVGCWGANDRGQLGNTTITSSSPLGLVGVSDIVKIAARSSHACALTSGGTLYCWGANAASQLGVADTVDHATPVQTRTGVTDVVVGSDHTCVVLTGGAIECAGSDAYGQRGDGSAALSMWTGPSTLSSVDKLVSGAYHLCALDGGKVYCWGYNQDGQLGVGTSGAGTNLTAPLEVPGLTGVDDIAAGSNHACALVDGAIYCWGLNIDFQCGGSSTSDQMFAVQVTGAGTATAVYAGGAHSCAGHADGQLLCWGSGAQGQLGHGAYTTRTGAPQDVTLAVSSSVALGGAHSCALISGDVYCWGDYAGTTFNSDVNVPTRIVR